MTRLNHIPKHLKDQIPPGLEPERTQKYGARRTWSELCDRWFDSKAEAVRGEELHLLQLAGEIRNLRYQVSFVLCAKPKITIKIDFAYYAKGHWQYEDVKGVLTRDSRTKLAWLKEMYGVDVAIIRKQSG